MIKENINVYKDTQDLSEGFTLFLLKLLEVYPHVNISLSGGSTPKVLFDYWAEHCKEKIDWNKISFFWGDERCVSPDDEMSNFKMTKEHLFDQLPQIKDNSIFRIKGESNPDEEAVRYSKILATELLTKNSIPSFELVILGMGDDGHTASIFPNQIQLWNEKSSCVVASHPETGKQRISLTGTVINKAQHVAFLVTGENKAEKIKEMIENRSVAKSKYPAALVNPEQGYLYWFLDEKAASLL
ncbi:6-phosphogluconolactonase [Apibacter sp. HY039]|uniref:6-phosphogluconolactonase n=1 Tax=Apibacter sp. HY039 TaxID=2501476 RepID=UPI000FEBD655|nr:6-phosphogluconolactonase [Apibacter sp. HY039]